MNINSAGVAAGVDYKALESFNGMLHLGEHLHDAAELSAEANWVSAGAVFQCMKIRATVDFAGHSPPLAALRELGSSPLSTR